MLCHCLVSWLLYFFLLANRQINSSIFGKPSTLNQTETFMQSAADSGKVVPVTLGTDSFKKFLEYKAANPLSTSPHPLRFSPARQVCPGHWTFQRVFRQAESDIKRSICFAVREKLIRNPLTLCRVTRHLKASALTMMKRL